MQFENPFSDQPVNVPGDTVDEVFEHLCRQGDDAHTDEAGFDFYEAWNGPEADEPHVHTDPSTPIETCPVCGPLLADAIIADHYDPRFEEAA